MNTVSLTSSGLQPVLLPISCLEHVMAEKMGLGGDIYGTLVRSERMVLRNQNLRYLYSLTGELKLIGLFINANHSFGIANNVG